MAAATDTVSPARDSAIAILREEHRSMGYLVHTLQRVLRDVAADKAEADFQLVATMLYYIDTFPDRCHHPKEDEHLFRRLRSRAAAAGGLLDALQEQHRLGPRMMTCMAQVYVHWHGGAPHGLKVFTQAVDAYAQFLRNHVEQEESQVLRLAREHLLESDWCAIDAAFRANDDPLFGPHVRDEFARLRMRIVNRLPTKHRGRPRG